MLLDSRHLAYITNATVWITQHNNMDYTSKAATPPFLCCWMPRPAAHRFVTRRATPSPLARVTPARFAPGQHLVKQNGQTPRELISTTYTVKCNACDVQKNNSFSPSSAVPGVACCRYRCTAETTQAQDALLYVLAAARSSSAGILTIHTNTNKQVIV